MIVHQKHAATMAALALAIAAGSVALPSDALARKRAHIVQPIAPAPPPSIGYYGEFPRDLDYAQAQAWSLREPYYRHFLYDYCDYRNCKLEWRNGNWVPVWYGPPA
jgi:hypothetical protein